MARRVRLPGRFLEAPAVTDSLVLYAPRDRFLVLLCEGWRLPWIVQTERSGWSVLMWKPA